MSSAIIAQQEMKYIMRQRNARRKNKIKNLGGRTQVSKELKPND